MPEADRTTRGRMSRIQQLPAPIKARLDKLLSSGVSQKDILAHLAPLLEEIGERPLSAPALNRYATRMEAMGRRIREAREVAAVWAEKFGEQPAGDLSSSVIEMLRMLSFELTHRADEDGSVDVETLRGLALTMQRLERASKLNADRERALRKELAELAAEEAEKAAAAESEKTGHVLPPAALQAIREQVYGIVDA
ncbi:MAG: DUF3486 family protein [Acidobacteria bacterium]|nr:DUF3486 family protein [Acidobacteriota bacterium]